MIDVRKNPIHWDTPTHILFAENDNMINFVNHTNSTLTVMKEGEHWFHTEEQMKFLDNWFKNFIN